MENTDKKFDVVGGNNWSPVYCIHCCEMVNCMACKEIFIQKAVLYLYEKWWLDGREGEVLDVFRKRCWDEAEGLWLARFRRG